MFDLSQIVLLWNAEDLELARQTLPFRQLLAGSTLRPCVTRVFWLATVGTASGSVSFTARTSKH